MNRDEQLSRMSALPPATLRCGALRAIYPHEWSGGTWIGTNEAGMVCALINWYSRPRRARAGTISRGEVIPALLAAETILEAGVRLAKLPLECMNPFRLIVASSREKVLREWRWGGDDLEEIALPWKRRHWFSSGYDEAGANRLRARACAREARLDAPESAAWLRRLHRSHGPASGPYSICMHRADACTVSYTEVSVNDAAAAMMYSAGPACQRGPRYARTLRMRAEEICRVE
jgi:hypothetical protein